MSPAADARDGQESRFEAACEVNGREVVLAGHPMDRLLDSLRDRLGLTGTKEGCGEGECGACTVLLDGVPVLSCLVPLLQCEGRRIETVEGIAAEEEARPLLDRIVAAGGVQCGACTPGIAVTAWALVRENPRPTRAETRRALAGNLCRCTGYEAILRAVTAERDSAEPGITERDTPEPGISAQASTSLTSPGPALSPATQETPQSCHPEREQGSWAGGFARDDNGNPIDVPRSTRGVSE